MRQANSKPPTTKPEDEFPEIEPALLEIERELEASGRTLDDTINMRTRRPAAKDMK